MAIKKVEMRPPDNGFGDVLYPKTSADIVELLDDGGKIAATTVEGAIAELSDKKLDASQKSAAHGVASLDNDAKVPLVHLPDGTTSAKGVVQLSGSVESDSTATAATSSAVKQAYDLAASKATTNVATPSSDGLSSAADKTKLDGIQAKAEVNQNAFSNVKVGGSTIAADTKTDTLEIINGDGIVLSANTSLDALTISVAFSDSHTSTSSTTAATSKAVKTLKDETVLKATANEVTGSIYEKGTQGLPNSSRPSVDLLSIPDGTHYRGAVTGRTGYPSANGSIFGYKSSASSYAASWQFFKPDASNARMMYRSGGAADTWGVWSELETTASSQEKANNAEQNAMAYTDDQILAVMTSGIPKLASYQYVLTASTDGQTIFTIPLGNFDPANDTVILSQNGTTLSTANYAIKKNANTNAHYIELNKSVVANTELFLLIMKNVLVGPEGDIRGEVLRVSSIPLDRMAETVETPAGAQTKVNTHAADAVKHITSGERNAWNSKAEGTHTHPVSQITNLQTLLDGKAPTTHSHTIAQVTNLQTTLDSKETPTGAQDKVDTHAADAVKHLTAAERTKWNSKAEGTHSHPISQVTDLQTILDSKETPTGAQTKVNTHAADSVKHITTAERLDWNSKAKGVHGHVIADVTDLQTTLDAKETPAGAQDKVDTHAGDTIKHITTSERANWNSKAAGTHSHTIAQVTSLQATLDAKETPAGAQTKVDTHAGDTVAHLTADERAAWNAKAAGTHSHPISQVTNLQTTLDAKETPAGAQSKVDSHAEDAVKHITASERTSWNSKAAGTHSHAVSEVVGLQTALDSKETPAAAQSKVDSHAEDAVKHVTAAERTSWNGKAAGTHSHTIAQVTNLQSTLDAKETPAGAQGKVDTHAGDTVIHLTAAERTKWNGKAEGTHTHAMTQVTGLSDALDGKAAATHSHTIAQVTNLQTTLDAKETPAGAQAKVDTHADDAVKHITAAERTAWNGKAAGSHTHTIANTTGLQAALDAKETPAGAQAKADAALSGAKTYTDAQVSALVEAAPETLDTLNEIAAALGDDPNFATTVTTQIGTKADKTVFEAHADDAIKHITPAERSAWNGKAAGTHSHTIAQVTNLQTTLDGKAASSHTHTIANVTGLQAELNAKETPAAAQAKVDTHATDTSLHVSPADRAAWNAKAGDAHSHAIGEIIGLSDALDGKAASSHTHTIANTSGLQAALDAKETPSAAQSKVDTHASDAVKHITAAERTAWNGKANASHTHTIANVTGLQTELDAKETPASAQSKVDTHAADAVKHITASERTTWNGKANASHTHTIANVTGLQTELDAKETPTGAQTKVNTHAGDSVAHITAAERTSWNGKAAGSHTHTIANVANLQSTLDAKETIANVTTKVEAAKNEAIAATVTKTGDTMSGTLNMQNNKVAFGNFSIQFNATEDSLDFVYG